MTGAGTAITLLYHDTYQREPAESGFLGPAADRYKLAHDLFERHLDAIRAAQPLAVSSVLVAASAGPRIPSGV